MSRVEDMEHMPDLRQWVTYNGENVRVVKRDLGGRNVWVERGTEKVRVMFSLRNDGGWRMFPGPADGPCLTWIK